MATGEKPDHSQILIEIWPVNVRSLSEDLKMIALLRCAIPQARIPT